MNTKRKTNIYNKNNKMKKSELKEMIKNAMLDEYSDDYIKEVKHPSEVFTDAELDMASEMLRDMFDKLGLENNIEKSDALVKYINGWFETTDFVNEQEEVEVEDEVETTTDNEKEGISVQSDAESDLTGVVGKIQDNLEAALEAARELGDEKLENQIGNTLTFFTRAHVVKEAAKIDVDVDSPAEDAEIGMKLDESINRMRKLAGLIK